MPGSVVVCLHVGLLSKRFRVQISARVDGTSEAQLFQSFCFIWFPALMRALTVRCVGRVSNAEEDDRSLALVSRG